MNKSLLPSPLKSPLATADPAKSLVASPLYLIARLRLISSREIDITGASTDNIPITTGFNTIIDSVYHNYFFLVGCVSLTRLTKNDTDTLW